MVRCVACAGLTSSPATQPAHGVAVAGGGRDFLSNRPAVSYIVKLETNSSTKQILFLERADFNINIFRLDMNSALKHF